MTRRLLPILLVLLTGCTPATPTPNALATQLAPLANRILALEHSVQYILVPVMTLEADLALTPSVTPTSVQNLATITPFCTQTPTPRPTWTSAMTATPQPGCRSCATGRECKANEICMDGPVGPLCVPRNASKSGYQECLRQLLSWMINSYEGPPEAEIDLDALMQDATERRFEP